MTKNRLAFFMVILTYFLIVFGGYVASSESGMGCGPEWPLCNGKVIPELHGETLIEFGHRVIEALIFVLSVVLFIKVKKDSTSSPNANNAANWMIVLLVLQLVAGAIVVFYHLPAIIVTLHLLMAMIFLGILIWFWRSTNTTFMKQRANIAFITHLDSLIVLLLITIVVGAYVKHQNYGLACGWLQCGESFIPTTIPEIIQFIHRLLAFVVALYTIFITYIACKEEFRRLKIRMTLALIVLIAQIVIGILTILTSISISFAVWHLAAATLVLAIIMEARFVVRK